LDKLDLEVISALRELEVPVHLLGYEYIKTALNVLRTDPSTIHRIIKELYPAIAGIHNTKSSRVERGIRHALTFAFMDLAVLKKVIGTSRKLTNSEFLATLHEVIMIKLATNPVLVEVDRRGSH